ncbi:MAG TPA: BrnT family toxin [Anaeromyxobacter sp.]|nr:BrnT family toxin [Anaeromyxobacter sp.]
MRFDWDPEKAASNLKKHGVSLQEAASVFADPLATARTRVIQRGRASSAHPRCVGFPFCVFVERNEDEFRIISARKVTALERRRYEEGTEA